MQPGAAATSPSPRPSGFRRIVMFELDILWIVVGGESPVEYLRDVRW
jgi:hypothetical protein